MSAENYWDQGNAQQPQPAQQQYQPAQQQFVQPAQPAQQQYQQPQQQFQPAQQPYQQPQQQFVQPTEVTSLGSWVLNLLLVAIPIVGIVMLLVWAFGSTPDESKKNWARANLIWILIAIVVYVILFAVMGVSFTSLYNS